MVRSNVYGTGETHLHLKRGCHFLNTSSTSFIHIDFLKNVHVQICGNNQTLAITLCKISYWNSLFWLSVWNLLISNWTLTLFLSNNLPPTFIVLRHLLDFTHFVMRFSNTLFLWVSSIKISANIFQSQFISQNFRWGTWHTLFPPWFIGDDK